VATTRRPKGYYLTLVLLASLVFYVHALEQRRTVTTARLMSGWTVVIDPGHGGVDTGARGRSGVMEDDVVLRIALELKALLQAEGVQVVMTRDADIDLAQPGTGHRQRESLEKRVAIIKDGKADLAVSVHCNAVPSSQWYGAQVFYDGSRNDGSKLLAECIQAEIARLVGGTSRQASQKIDHFILKNSNVPSITVEAGFLSNPREERLLSQRDYQRSIAWGIFSGLMKYALTTAATIGGRGDAPRR
jgi:N-acetylmuramoyl-L-alanine amidase